MKQKLNVALIAGISCNVLLVLIFGYFYYLSVPKAEDIISPPTVVIPIIEDAKLKSDLAALKKIEGIPIYVDESELGKQDPYNP